MSIQSDLAAAKTRLRMAAVENLAAEAQLRTVQEACPHEHPARKALYSRERIYCEDCDFTISYIEWSEPVERDPVKVRDEFIAKRGQP